YGAIDYRSAVARLKMETGDVQTARDLLAECIEFNKAKLRVAPSDPETLYRLAAAEASFGDSTASRRDLRAAIKAGWIEHRSSRLDPRFDNVRQTPEFQTILSDLAKHVADLGARPSAKLATNTQEK